MEQTAQGFFEACEAGKGWQACAPYCKPDASFSAQAEPRDHEEHTRTTRHSHLNYLPGNSGAQLTYDRARQRSLFVTYLAILGNSGFVVGEHGFGPAPPLDTVDAPILKPSAFGRGWDLGASVHGGAEGRAGDASLLPKRLITMGLRQKNRFNECKECGCAPANNHTCPDLGFQLPIRIAVAGPVAATKGPEALGRAGRSMFWHSRGPIDHLGLFSSRITTALGN